MGYRRLFFVGIFVFVLSLQGCGVQNKEIIENFGATQSRQTENVYEITKADVKTEYANEIVIDVADAKQKILIEDGGDYVLTGEGKSPVVIDAQDQVVHVILHGVEIRSNNGPAIEIRSAGKVIITVKENTENILRDSGNYRSYAESNATIYSNTDLTINGDGLLYVYGFYKDAIHSKDLLKVLGGTIYLQAKRDGLRGNDGLVVSPQYLSIESEADGLHTTNADKAKKGSIEVRGGEIVITAGEYAINAEADIHVSDCMISCFSVLGDVNHKGKAYIQEECMNNE